MAMGACPGQIPMPCVPPALMVTATMVRACRYSFFDTMRLPLFWHCETVQISFFSEIFLLLQRAPINFLIFCNTMDVQKILKGPPFHIFWHYATYRRLQKNFEKKFGKKLDKAPTWAVPDLFPTLPLSSLVFEQSGCDVTPVELL